VREKLVYSAKYANSSLVYTFFQKQNSIKRPKYV
jgi:hypothetical protein